MLPPDYNTLPATISALVIGLILLFWHKGLSEYLSRFNKLADDKSKTKLDQILFVIGVVVVTFCALWLLRVIGE